jgi:NADPH:quinone reductase-like Zn-dependent oxidoreductase
MSIDFPGDSPSVCLLTNSASDGVGTFAVQIARIFAAKERRCAVARTRNWCGNSGPTG